MSRKIPSERQVQSQVMKQTIHDAAKALLLQKGFEGVTVDEICAEVGVTKGTFYNYYRSKEQLVLDDIAADNLYYRKKLYSQVAKLQPGRDKLFAFLRLAMAFEQSKQKELARLSYRLRIADTKKVPFPYPDKRELYRIIEELVASGQACGEIRRDLDSSSLATIIFYSIRGVVYSWCLPNTDFNLTELGEELFEVLGEGLKQR